MWTGAPSRSTVSLKAIGRGSVLWFCEWLMVLKGRMPTRPRLILQPLSCLLRRWEKRVTSCLSQIGFVPHYSTVDTWRSCWGFLFVLADHLTSRISSFRIWKGPGTCYIDHQITCYLPAFLIPCDSWFIRFLIADLCRINPWVSKPQDSRLVRANVIEIDMRLSFFFSFFGSEKLTKRVNTGT